MNDLIWLLLLLFLSGFFSGAEIALFSLGPEKIKALKAKIKKKKQLRRVEVLEKLKSDNEKLLVTILLGNNVVNVGSSAMATVLAQNWAASSGYGASTTMVVGIVTGVMTFMILLFGEIVPKSICRRNALKFSLFVSPILLVLQVVLYPIIAPLAKFLGKFSDDEERHSLSEDELKAAVALSEEEGKIDTEQKEWVERILEFDEHTVASVMTPRSKVFALESSLKLGDAIKEIKEVGFSRIPIYEDDLDHVMGILTIRTMLERSTEKDFANLPITQDDLWEPLKIPITMKIDTMLETFQKEKTHIALVYDEHGGLVGLITLEDVLEEIFGEIQDEEDEESLDIRIVGSRLIRCSGETELEQLEHFVMTHCKDMPARFPWSKAEENKTMGLFILEHLEKFPELDEIVMVEILEYEYAFTIKKLEEERIKEVEMTWKKI
ncbi:MAG TPA: hemolysin family protein [Candidatus Gracilibacteria bacterium]